MRGRYLFETGKKLNVQDTALCVCHLLRFPKKLLKTCLKFYYQGEKNFNRKFKKTVQVIVTQDSYPSSA